MVSGRLMGEASVCQDFEALSLSQRVAKSVSQKLKRKSNKGKGDEEDSTKGTSLRCLTVYGRSGGCKVCVDTSDPFGDHRCRRRSGASEEGKGYPSICGTEETSVVCIPYGAREKFWKRNNRKLLQLEESPHNIRMHVFLPDDILEMCLVRVPLTSLHNVRLVCRKWRNLTTTPRFLQIRREGLYESPWLFLFGFVKDGYCSGEIHALDVSLNQWHRLDAEFLKGRYLFSVASIRDDIYIVGGRSSLTNYGRVDRTSYKTHKGVFLFNPSTKSWHTVASMKHARSTPVLGICVSCSDSMVIRNQQNRQERHFPRSRVGGVSDVYEDPRRLSVRRQLMNSNIKPFKLVKQNSDNSNIKDGKRFVLIAVGGLGQRDEFLDSGEIYDSVSNKWTEIQSLPVDFGVVCSGVVCEGMFYIYSENDKLAGFDVERGYWVGIQTRPFPPRVHDYYPKLISSNGRLFMLSVLWCEGDDQIGRRNKAVRKLWELRPAYLDWKELSTHPDAPMDWNAAFVADRNLIFGVEMFKIFGQVLDFLSVYDVSDTEMKWSHISRNHMAHELDASSCMTKSMAVLHL